MPRRASPHSPESLRALATALFTALAALASSCAPPVGFGDSASGDASDDLADLGFPGFEVSVDVRLPGRVCTRNAECDDGIECTDDLCGSDNRCISTPNSGRCDNMRYCDGAEVCDTRRGCTRGDPVSCDDSDTCTADRCDEETRTCMHKPLDRDGDGDPDDHCNARPCGDAGVPEPDTGVVTACWRGRDCDDRDPRVNSNSPEICGDGIDNNCNGSVDSAEPGGCRRAPNDGCDDPRDISAGGTFTLDLSAARSDFTVPCAGSGLHDVVLRFRLTEPRDVAIDGSARSSSVGLALRRLEDCAVPGDTPNVACAAGFPARIRKHSLPAGDYVVIVVNSGNEPVEVTAQFPEATPQPTNDACSMATVIPPEGATYRSDLIGLADDVSTRCGGNAPDALYTFELTSARNVTLQLQSGRNQYAQLSLLSGCGRSPAPTTLKCDAGTAFSYTAYSLPAGRYYVAVESYDALTYTLQARFAPPTPPPAGDVCESAIALTPNAAQVVSGSAFENDYALSCYSTGGDGVFRFDLATRSDVMLDLRASAGEYFGVAIQSTCGERMGERTCVAASTPRAFALGLDPGRYYGIVKNGRGADYTVTLRTFPPVATTMVTGNDTCETAYLIPPGRAYLRGDTTMLGNQYRVPCGPTMGNDAVYQLNLTTRSRVTLVLETGFYGALALTQRMPGTCPGTAPSVGGTLCSLGSRTNVDVTLDAGEYNVIVDGYGASNNGPYSLLVQTDPAP